ncbi:MAG: GIY-YIG nuclease family protein [Bacteroidota bacterium]
MVNLKILFPAMGVTVQFRSRVQNLILPRAGFFMYKAYILYSENFGRYYVGHCADMDARLLRHNLKRVTSTKAFVPWKVVYTESFLTRSEAGAREKAIKNKKSRIYIEKLIGSGTGSHVPM